MSYLPTVRKECQRTTEMNQCWKPGMSYKSQNNQNIHITQLSQRTVKQTEEDGGRLGVKRDFKHSYVNKLKIICMTVKAR